MGRLAPLLLLLLVGCGANQGGNGSDGLRVGDALGGDSTGYARATEVRPFRFPEDHGPHPDFRNEWWYVTGNLADGQGRRYGFQLTLFRIALSPEPVGRASAWATRQVYMGHFAVTDAAAGRFLAYDRFARAAIGLAGARAEPFAVWLEDWRLEAAPEGGFPWRLTAAADGVELELELETAKGPVLQGDRGLSQKSAEPGNASYYYSLTRLRAAGSLQLEGAARSVSGTAWLDREWSTSALGEGQTGWDWFALQFDDGTELMYYRLRREEGGSDPHSEGTLVRQDGTSVHLGRDDVVLEPVDWWESPRGGRYPVEWRLRVPVRELEVAVRPLLRDQELDVTVRYWEGAVTAHGTREGRPVTGRGYLEMTGYGETRAVGRTAQR